MNQEGIYRKIQSLGETDYAVRKLATKFYWAWFHGRKNISIPMREMRIHDPTIAAELLQCGVRYIEMIDTMFISEHKIRSKVRAYRQAHPKEKMRTHHSPCYTCDTSKT